MAAPTLAARAPGSLRAATKDLEQFAGFLKDGAPGPHAYAVLLGLKTFDAAALLKIVWKGLPYRALERFQENTAMSIEVILSVIDLPRRTLTRRKREGRLQPAESDRLLRASRLFGQALELFDGDRDAAAGWLTTRQTGLGGAMPLDLARTELGAREVERLLTRLEHGVFS